MTFAEERSTWILQYTHFPDQLDLPVPVTMNEPEVISSDYYFLLD